MPMLEVIASFVNEACKGLQVHSAAERLGLPAKAMR